MFGRYGADSNGLFENLVIKIERDGVYVRHCQEAELPFIDGGRAEKHHCAPIPPA